MFQIFTRTTTFLNAKGMEMLCTIILQQNNSFGQVQIEKQSLRQQQQQGVK
jgi:hypothetical protein